MYIGIAYTHINSPAFQGPRSPGTDGASHGRNRGRKGGDRWTGSRGTTFYLFLEVPTFGI